MKLTDLFIRRPVLSAVVSLLILVLGLRAIFQLPVTQFPQTENGVITISTTYYGADAQTVAGFITQPLEAAIAQAQGIDYLSSVSSAGSSVITATLEMNYSSSKALTEISTQVNAVRNQLPPQSQLPIINLQANQTTDILYLNYSSKVLPTNDVTDYLLRVVQPKLNSIPGVQTAEILGGRTFALRAWLDPDRMAAHGVTAGDVYTGTRVKQLPVGRRREQRQHGQRQPDRLDGPAFAAGFQAAGDPAGERRDRAAGGRGDGRARRARTTTPASPTAASPECSSASSPRLPRTCSTSSSRSERTCPTSPAAASQRHPSGDRLRRHDVHQHIDQGRHQDTGRGAAHRHRGHLPLPRQSARRRGACHRDAVVAGRRLHRDAAARLFDQSVDAARARARDRPGSR